MELISSHNHTVRSGHGSGTVLELVDAAAAAGLSTIAVTEHLPLPEGVDPIFECSMAPETVSDYLAEIEEARDRHPELCVITGGELDWLSWRDDDLETRREVATGLEYVLGSVHFIDGWAFDDPAHKEPWYDPEKADAAWMRYLEIWCEMATSDLPIDTLAHPDLVKKFGIYPSFELDGWYEQMVDAAVRSGRMIEVNTAGLFKDVGEEYPAPKLLSMFCAAGVDCTIGSDAHCPADVARGLDRGYRALYEAGYRRLTVPTRDHDRRYIPLEA